MTTDEIIRTLKEHADAIRARGVVHLDLFGSAARGEAGPDSDIDVVIDIEPDHKFSLIDVASLRVFLCDIFGREVDVVVREDLRPRFRAEVELETVQVL